MGAHSLTGLAIRVFVTLFVIVDPIGLTPIFMALAGDRDPEQQRHLARRTVLVAGGVMLTFALVGGPLLHHFGISLDAFRIAGGILLFRIAAAMVFATLQRETAEEKAEAMTRRDISVFPMAIPMMAGPGALASVMILAGEAEPVRFGVLIVLTGIAAIAALSYLAFRAAGPLGRVLGQTGVNVITRVLGVVLAALAVQYVADGVRGLLPRL